MIFDNSQQRLSRAFSKAQKVSFNNSSRIVLFSDCHRGDNSFADDFANNRNIYYHALQYYYREGFTYCELGDGDELWENHSFSSLFDAHKNVYKLLREFHLQERLMMIWGNHDMEYRNPDFVNKNLGSYYEPIEERHKELLENLTFHESIILRHSETGQELFLLHGHQADWWNYNAWKMARFLVRVLWKPLQVWGIADPTSPAKNYTNLIRVERRIKEWMLINDTILTICGHTHRPRFPEPGDIPFFNDGSCVHPRSITGLEIDQGNIALVKWHLETTQEGMLQVVRVVLEGPTPLAAYHADKINI